MTRGQTTSRRGSATNRAAVVVAIFLLLNSFSSAATEIGASFDEIAQTADLIFVGTVAGSSSRVDAKTRMVFTEVEFEDIEVIHANSSSSQRESSTIRLTFGGGAAEGRMIVVTGNPRFTNGERHLLFVFDDSRIYVNPIVGGFQGLFRVMQDGESRSEYVLSHDNRLVTGFGPEKIRIGSGAVSSIVRGQPVFKDGPADNAIEQPMQPPPLSAGDLKSSAFAVPPTKRFADSRPLLLEDFTAHIKNTALRRPIPTPRFRLGGSGGHLVLEKDGKLRTMPFPENDASVRPLPRPEASVGAAAKGAPLYACGSQNLNIVMYQVPYPSTMWDVNNDSMWIWTLYMDVFRYKSYAGSWNDDSRNEFAGYVSESTLNDLFGFSWGTGIGMTIFDTNDWPCECCEIWNSDVLLNPAYTFTDSDTAAIDNPDLVHMRFVVMHELGHVVGFMTNPYTEETYDYDVPSVMHAYSYDVVENARGLHAPDASIFRRNYDDQTAVLQIEDFGVESYHAANGLHISTTDASQYHQGDPITISDLTVENMGTAPVENLQLRLYLSPDRTIFDSDHKIGDHLAWPSFAKESWSVFSVSSTVPQDMPPGDYFVGALVSKNGLSSDNFYPNNTTTLTHPVRILPLPPAWLSASDRRWDYRVRVTWDPVPGATGYDVYRKTCTGCTPVWIGNTVDLAFDDSASTYGTTPECTYLYGIRADSVVGSGRMSEFDAGSSRFPTPAQVTASEGLADGVTLTWSPVPEAPYHRIWRSDDPLSDGTSLVLVGNIGSFKDTTVPAGRRHYYRVSAVNPCGEGDLSAAASGYSGQLTEIFKDDFETRFTDRWSAEQPAIWYADCDQDGFASVWGTGIEQTHDPGTPPLGCSNGTWTPVAPASIESRDCQDRNSDAHPAQSSFFDIGYYLSGNPGGDEYDYNCDGREEESSTTLSPSGDYISCIFVDSQCVGNLPAGWVSFTVPMCGQTMTWVECGWVPRYPYLSCEPVFTEKTQTCR